MIGDGSLRTFPRVAGRDPRGGHVVRCRGISRGPQTPVFFGSALTNFGLEPFLQALVEFAPRAAGRPSDTGIVHPTDERFTGFVFKIQANMDPRHRDRVAFVRVCSGRFTKDMTVSNAGWANRSGRRARTASSAATARRSSVAYAGDIIGLVNPGQFAIGDTLHSGAALRFPDLPTLPGRAVRPHSFEGRPLQAVR